MTLQAPVLDHAHWQTWHAHLHLDFDRTDRGTRLAAVDHQGPLYVQRPFYPEGRDLAHIYLLHPPGGMVSGDLLEIRLRLAAGAQVLATTPGAGRAYGARSDGSRQRQRNELRVAANAVLEWFPMENIVYNGADLQATTRVHLDQGARFLGWEINCLGLPASAEPFDRGSLMQHFQLDLEGRPGFVDQLRLHGADRQFLNAAAGLAGHKVSGTFLAGPFDDSVALTALAAQLQLDSSDPGSSVSCLNHFLVARYLGHSAFNARRGFVQVWNALRPTLLNRPGCAPRIWAT